jgi:hypothetical protein
MYIFVPPPGYNRGGDILGVDYLQFADARFLVVVQMEADIAVWQHIGNPVELTSRPINLHKALLPQANHRT